MTINDPMVVMTNLHQGNSVGEYPNMSVGDKFLVRQSQGRLMERAGIAAFGDVGDAAAIRQAAADRALDTGIQNRSGQAVPRAGDGMTTAAAILAQGVRPQVNLDEATSQKYAQLAEAGLWEELRVELNGDGGASASGGPDKDAIKQAGAAALPVNATLDTGEAGKTDEEAQGTGGQSNDPNGAGDDLDQQTVGQLKETAKAEGIPNVSGMNRPELLDAIREKRAQG